MTTNQATRDPTSVTSLEDTSLVAFLKLKGHIAIPWISRDDPQDIRVSFDIQGNEQQVEADIQAFYANEKVGIQDFCRCLKDIKSSMYNLRRIGMKM
jgi:hypothetical protein